MFSLSKFPTQTRLIKTVLFFLFLDSHLSILFFSPPMLQTSDFGRSDRYCHHKSLQYLECVSLRVNGGAFSFRPQDSVILNFSSRLSQSLGCDSPTLKLSQQSLENLDPDSQIFGFQTNLSGNWPWWPSGLECVSNSKRHSREDLVLNPCLRLQYQSLRSRNTLS